MDKPARKKGVNGKQKGKRAEADVAAKLSEWLGLPASEFTRARAGKKEPDVALSQAAAAVFPFHVEVKAHALLEIPKWVAQAVHDSPLVSFGREPIVVYKDKRKLWVVTRLEHYLALWDAYCDPQLMSTVVSPTWGPKALQDKWIVLMFDEFMELATQRCLDAD